MPSGQLAFIPAQQAFVSTVGLNSYVVVKGLASSTPTTQFQSLYIGASAVRSLGGSDNLNTAINLCQTDATALST